MTSSTSASRSRLLLFPHLAALENVAFPLRARGIPKEEARGRAMRLLDRLGVRDRAGARPRDLSGGEAQRVALARALVGEPALLLLDEPLSALDVGARVRVRDVVREELARFPGVRVLVTHDPVEASILADRLVLIEEGRVTQVGTPEEIRTSPRSRVRLATSPPLVAEVTIGSVERLGLRVEALVWASFKAVEVRVLPS